MTREDAKREIMFAKRNVMADSWIDKAYDMAIKALEQPVPCEDAVNREAVLHKIDVLKKTEDGMLAPEDIAIAVTYLPTVTPKMRTGRFLGTAFDGYADGYPVYFEWQCSECGCVFEDEEPTYNFCPNCGADMREGAEQDADG